MGAERVTVCSHFLRLGLFLTMGSHDNVAAEMDSPGFDFYSAVSESFDKGVSQERGQWVTAKDLNVPCNAYFSATAQPSSAKNPEGLQRNEPCVCKLLEKHTVAGHTCMEVQLQSLEKALVRL